jgi:GNAT superfamily N-acetyltransferase
MVFRGNARAASAASKVVQQADAGSAYLQIHPDYRHIEEEMVAWAEERIHTTPTDGAASHLNVYAYEYDAWRQHLLQGRGFVRTNEWGILRRLRFGQKLIPPVQMPAGYTLSHARAGNPREHEQSAVLLNAAFGRTFHQAADTRTFRAPAPSYRANLDLFAIAPDGSLAANVGVIYAPAVRAGLYEPVCTHPAHRQKGLAKILMWEGMRRLRALGADEVTVAAGDMIPANHLYDAVGFPEVYRGYTWRKVWYREDGPAHVTPHNGRLTFPHLRCTIGWSTNPARSACRQHA